MNERWVVFYLDLKGHFFVKVKRSGGKEIRSGSQRNRSASKENCSGE